MVADRYAYLSRCLGPRSPARGCCKASILAGGYRRRRLSRHCSSSCRYGRRCVWHDTLALFSHTLELNPTSLAATRSLGFYWAEHHDDVRRRRAYYDLAERDASRGFHESFQLCECASAQWFDRPRDRAISGCDRDRSANAQYQLNYGVALATANRDEEVLAAFQAAAAIDPAGPDAWQNAGLMLEKLAGSTSTSGVYPRLAPDWTGPARFHGNISTGSINPTRPGRFQACPLCRVLGWQPTLRGDTRCDDDGCWPVRPCV